MSNADLSAVFSNAQQGALVGHALTDEEFLIKCKAHVKPEWMTGDILVAHIYKELCKFYENYKMMPRSGDELLSEPFFKGQNPTDFQKYKNTVILCIQHGQNFSLEILRPKIADFIRVMKIKEHVKGMALDVNKSNYEKVLTNANSLVRVGNEIDFDKNPYVDFSDTLSVFAIKPDDKEGAMSTGSKTLDYALSGGIFRKENMAVLAPTFTGKSRFMITLARHLLVQKRKVLFVIHEDNPDKVKRRIISSLVGIGVKELSHIMFKKNSECPFQSEFWNDDMNNQLYEITKNELLKARDILLENLIFLPWQKTGKMFVEDVVEEIKRINMEQIAKTGRPLDAIIDDYPALLLSKMRHENTRDRLSYVYSQFNILANEINVFCAYAVQVNRAASKQMKTGEAEMSISLEDTSESYQIAMNAMSAISLNRTPEDIPRNILRIAVIKARDSIANSVVLTRSAYNECVLYGDYENFTESGQMLSQGLTSVRQENLFVKDTSTVNTMIEEAEAELPLAKSEFMAKLPKIIKQIKKMPGGT